MICAASASVAILAAADGAIARVLKITTNVADLCVDKTLVSKVPAVEVLGAPEAACGHGAALSALGND
ncbi:hypothetical protein HG531_001911 [Fusarium graminearum]|nr:hypothetical protein HG531_001911 [Fusarium graminearum]